MSTGPASSDAARHQLARRLNAAVGQLDDPATPMVVIDLDAFDANMADLARRAAGKPIRVASKSLRVPALLERALADPAFSGVLSYSLREALWLVREGITDDVVMGYPSVDRGALRQLLADDRARAGITLMVDNVAQLSLVEACGEARACAWRSTSTPGSGSAAPTSARSARRCTTRPRWSASPRRCWTVGSRWSA